MTDTMRVVELPAVGADLRSATRPVPSRGPGEVRVRIEACGVCGSDVFLQKGGFGDAVSFPVIPGHEAAGVVDALGDGVDGVAVGDQVAIYYISTPPDDSVGRPRPPQHQPAGHPDGRRRGRRVRRVRAAAGRRADRAAGARRRRRSWRS